MIMENHKLIFASMLEMTVTLDVAWNASPCDRSPDQHNMHSLHYDILSTVLIYRMLAHFRSPHSFSSFMWRDIQGSRFSDTDSLTSGTGIAGIFRFALHPSHISPTT